MENAKQPKAKSTRILILVLCALVVVSIIFVAVLLSEKSTLTTDYDALQTEYDQALADMDDLEEDLAETSEYLESANESVDSMSEQITQLTADSEAAAEESLASINTLQEEYDVYVASAEENAASLEASIAALQAEYDSYIASAEENAASLETQLAALQAEYDTAVASADENAAALEAQLSALQSEYDAYIAGAEENAASLEESVASLEAQLAALQAEYDEYAAGAQESLDTAEADIASLQSEYDAYVLTAEASADLQSTEYASLQNEYDAYMAEAEAALTALQAEYDTYIAETEATLTALETEYAAYITSSETERASLEDALTALQDEYDAYVSDAEASLAALQAENDAYAAAAEAEEAITEATVAQEEAVQETAVEEETAEVETAEVAAVAEETVEEAAVEEAAVEEAAVEEAAVEEETDDGITLADDDVVATVNGTEVTGADVMAEYEFLASYYGEPDEDELDLYYAVAMDEAVEIKLVAVTAEEMGLALTDEEIEAAYATAEDDWNDALDNYVSYYYSLTSSSTEAAVQEAYAAAETYYGNLGYSLEYLKEDYLQTALYDLVADELCKDIVISDEDVIAVYDEAVEADRLLYEDNAYDYETASLMYQYGYSDDEPWYVPAGYRYIKHILLEVDDELMDAYTDLVEAYEAQDASDETTEDLVTEEDIENAKAEIIASVQDTIDIIYTSLEAGESFDDLMAEYGIDPGMTSGSYPNGYEVASISYGFVTEFVEGAFSVDTVGDVSDPFISDYGVHIIQYAGDVPEGGIELTDELMETIRAELSETEEEALLEAWNNEADIEYTGILIPYDELEDE